LKETNDHIIFGVSSLSSNCQCGEGALEDFMKKNPDFKSLTPAEF